MRVSKIAMPLKFYEDFSAFKLFMNDSGLFGALSETPIKDILLGSHVFEEYKGAFTEQFVEQQIASCRNYTLYYYTNNNSTNEIDFITQRFDKALPIEVKAEENLRSRSLKAVLDKDSSLRGLRISMSDYREEEKFDNLPLHTIFCNHCAQRLAKGKDAACAHHCQDGCITLGEIPELVEKMTGDNMVLYTL